jgi:hypothetical protein
VELLRAVFVQVELLAKDCGEGVSESRPLNASSDVVTADALPQRVFPVEPDGHFVAPVRPA